MKKDKGNIMIDINLTKYIVLVDILSMQWVFKKYQI